MLVEFEGFADARRRGTEQQIAGRGVCVLTVGPKNRESAPVTLDIVIPVYNEAKVLPALIRALGQTFSPETKAQHRIDRVTCFFVDDGSTDASVQFLDACREPGFEVVVIRLSRNFGHQAAITAGIAHTSGNLVAVMDADLQDPPACILSMIEKWRVGFEVVYAVRRKRKEGALKKFMYWAFYRIYRLLTPIAVPVDSGDFCLMSRRVVEELNRLPETVRFPRGLRSWVGFPQVAMEYDRPARFAGESRYGWRDLYALATEGLASLSLRPLQLAQVLSIVFLLLSLGGIAALTLGLFDSVDAGTRESATLVLILMSNSAVLFCLYIVGAYLGRAYLEVKGRPTYIVAEVIRPDAS